MMLTEVKTDPVSIYKEQIHKEEDVELGKVSQDISVIVAKEFNHLFCHDESTLESNFFEKIKNAEYFPHQFGKKSAHLKDFARLFYLTTFHETKKKKNPFKFQDIETFRISFERERQTEGWFKKAIVPFTVISCASYISFVNVSELSPGWQAAVSGTIGMVASIAINMVSLCITGTNPHHSKDIDNQKQNTIQRIKKHYDEMAQELIILNVKKPDLAKLFAERIDMQQIFKAATQNYLDRMEAKSIFQKLEDVLDVLKGEKKDFRHHDLKLCQVLAERELKSKDY